MEKLTRTKVTKIAIVQPDKLTVCFVKAKTTVPVEDITGVTTFHQMMLDMTNRVGR